MKTDQTQEIQEDDHGELGYWDAVLPLQSIGQDSRCVVRKTTTWFNGGITEGSSWFRSEVRGKHSQFLAISNQHLGFVSSSNLFSFGFLVNI